MTPTFPSFLKLIVRETLSDGNVLHETNVSLQFLGYRTLVNGGLSFLGEPFAVVVLLHVCADDGFLGQEEACAVKLQVLGNLDMLKRLVELAARLRNVSGSYGNAELGTLRTGCGRGRSLARDQL